MGGGTTGGKQSSKLKAFIAALGNFSVQYNFGCISMAVKFMGSHWGQPSEPGSPADFPEPAWAKTSLVPAVFAGSFLGMIAMGYVGDIIGRRKGMMLTLAFVVVGSAVSALGSWGGVEQVYAIIFGARFLLGFGVGGIYPMAAATAAESREDENDAKESEEGDAIVYDPRHALEVAQAFFWQTPGSLTPYIVALALTAVPSSATTTSVQFRTLLGLGALPAAVVFLATLLSTESASTQAKAASSSAKPRAAPNPYTIIRENPQHLAALVGTGGVWFLYDVSFYGTSIFTPQILGSIFGESETLLDVAWQSLVVGLMGLPGIFSAIALLRPRPVDGAGGGAEGAGPWEYRWPLVPEALDRRMCGWTARDLNIWGFILMTVCFAAMGGVYTAAPGANAASGAKFAIFCIIQFSLSWGPNTGTYVQPTQSFPKNIRTTMHGLSAAAGKAGAVVGTFMYAPMQAAVGFAPIMWLQALLSIIGSVASYYLIPQAVLGGGAGGGGARIKAGRGKAGAGDDDDDLSDKPLLDA